MFWGAVSSNAPSESEIRSMAKRVASYGKFTATMNLADEHSCFVSPMTNPISDIREKIFGLSIWNSYTVISNFPITMADGLTVPCRVVVKTLPEHTSGFDFDLDVVF